MVALMAEAVENTAATSTAVMPTRPRSGRAAKARTVSECSAMVASVSEPVVAKAMST